METISIALICSITGAVITFLTFQRNNRKEIEERTRTETEKKVQLDYIQKGIDEIRINDKIRDEQLKSMNDRLIIVENETKVLFKRFERLDEYYNVRDEMERK